jgi:glycine dehydrogenase
MKINLQENQSFETRHIGVHAEELKPMLDTVGVADIDELIAQTVPGSIRLNRILNLPAAKSEYTFLSEFRKLAAENKVFKSYIGQGYSNCITPPVILRNIIENPGWYTAYTPYQAEIAQGRLEMLINFQTMVTDLTGMNIANASLLDEGTAAAEAMSLLFHSRKGARKKSDVFVISRFTFPQTIDVVITHAVPLGIKVEIADITEEILQNPSVFGVLVQYPDSRGEVKNYRQFCTKARENDVQTAFAADLLSLTLLTPPGEFGADIVLGSTQRFGVPVGFGGPHAAYFASREEYKRQLPGRIIGASVDSNGKPALRMALQTREQHIRREKATSNICTSQVLLAVTAAAYALYHGGYGLKTIAAKINGLAGVLSVELGKYGFTQSNEVYFDTLRIQTDKTEIIRSEAEKLGYNFWYHENVVQIALDETTSLEDINVIAGIFASAAGKVSQSVTSAEADIQFPEGLQRKSEFLTHPVFAASHSEHEMLRYLKYLENKDLSMVHSMISLGSCTMKLNATTEMIPVTWPEFNQIHPFAPADQTLGYKKLTTELSRWLAEITGFSGISLQPNSGAQGEYAGLLVIRAYHESRGESHRNIALIPSSAHGTNPASAVIAGFEVVVVRCDERGNIDVEDLRNKVVQHGTKVGVLMITYPSTHGVFEESVIEICRMIHDCGGQVYMDGANMNAQVGLTSPGKIGADVCHLNLHKTFCIPHGGGGPGMGPIGVAEHLVPFLPSHPVVKTGGDKGIPAVSSGPWGSASILPISYAYISMMGPDGLTNATKYAILNANYLKARLESFYPVLYSGTKGRCAHEFILDCRAFKQIGVEVEDIAKRLMDYGFHAPTVSFPVPGTLMIEPTESESKVELDRFADAMILIRNEISEIETGKYPKDNNVLKNAPHTAESIISDSWNKPYSREKAAYPAPWLKNHKFWPSVGRIDSAYGDRNLVCSCLPVENYIEKGAKDLHPVQ